MLIGRFAYKCKKNWQHPAIGERNYCTDIGLRNARLNFRQQEETHIMENIIYNELLYREYSVDVGAVEDEGKRAKKQFEIDFVINKGLKKYYDHKSGCWRTPQKLAKKERLCSTFISPYK